MKRKHLGKALALLVMTLAAVAVVAVGRPAHGQEVCGDLSIFSKILEEAHSERIITIGEVGRQTVLIFSSAGGETWTILLMQPNGRVCVKMSGTGLTTIIPIPYTPPLPSEPS